MEENTREEELAAAGYTGRLGAIIFCSGLAILGASLGNIFIAIAFNALLGVEQEDSNLVLGTIIGAVIGVILGAFKVRQGNREAIAAVEDQQWRRELGPRGRRIL